MSSYVILLFVVVMFSDRFLSPMMVNNVMGNTETENHSESEVTEVEKFALEKFRPLVRDILIHDYHNDDNFLVRWLRAQNYDIEAAVQMFQTAHQWRKENQIDNILNETILELKSPAYIVDGVDGAGDPVVELSIGRLDFRKYLLSGQYHKLERYFVQLNEVMASKQRAAQRAKNSTSWVSQSVTIADLEGVNVRQHVCFSCIRIFTDWVSNTEKYYPESSKSTIIINAPRVAIPVIDITKTFLSPTTRKGLVVFGSNREEWSSYLLTLIAPGQLSVQFGGERNRS